MVTQLISEWVRCILESISSNDWKRTAIILGENVDSMNFVKVGNGDWDIGRVLLDGGKIRRGWECVRVQSDRDR